MLPDGIEQVIAATWTLDDAVRLCWPPQTWPASRSLPYRRKAPPAYVTNLPRTVTAMKRYPLSLNGNAVLQIAVVHRASQLP